MFIFAPKVARDTEIFSADYSAAKMQSGDMIISASWHSTCIKGNDPNPSLMIQGSSTITGVVVNQMITGGVPNSTYILECVANTKLGETITLYGELTIVAAPNLP